MWRLNAQVTLSHVTRPDSWGSLQASSVVSHALATGALATGALATYDKRRYPRGWADRDNTVMTFMSHLKGFPL
jgi:hypothetical protein